MIVSSINAENNVLSILKKRSLFKKEGSLFYGRCPFCKSNGMVASEIKNVCHCFSCGKGGTAAEIIQLTEKLMFKELITKLPESFVTPLYRQQGKSYMQIYEIVTRFYMEKLKSPKGEKYRKYLYDRGLTDEVIERYRIGLAIESSELINRMKDICSIEQLKTVGIFSEKGHDRFYSRIVFPLIDYRGIVVGFTGRSLDSDPKYLNSPRTPLYDKGAFFYGLNTALPNIKNRVIIVEGQMDTIAMQTHGIGFALGVSGTGFTEDHAIILHRLLPNYDREIILCFDNDAAGVKATERAAKIIGDDDNIKVAISNLGKDASDHFRMGGTIQDFKTYPLQDFLTLFSGKK